MADTKISDLPATTSVADTDDYAVASSGVSKKITGANLKAGVLAGVDAPTQAEFDDHSARHESGGPDAIKLDDLAAPDDNTDLNASTTKHGLLRKLDNNAAHFLDGQGGWSTPTGSGGVATDPIWDAKGDLAVASAADTAARLPVGSNDQVVVADSGQTLGMKWAKVGEAMILLADVTTNDVTSTKHGFAPKSPADATKFLNGAATPAYALVKDSDLSTSDITTNDVSTSKHGFAPKVPNDATKYLDGTGAYSTPAGGGSGAVVQVFDSQLGAGATNIDTLATIAGTYNHLLIVLRLRSAASGSALDDALFLINNDTGSNYEWQRLRALNTTVSAIPLFAQTEVQVPMAGSTAAANRFGVCEILIPNYRTTDGHKTFTMQLSVADVAASTLTQTGTGCWKNTAAITRVAIFSASGNLAVGSRMTVYGLT